MWKLKSRTITIVVVAKGADHNLFQISGNLKVKETQKILTVRTAKDSTRGFVYIITPPNFFFFLHMKTAFSKTILLANTK